MRTKLAWYQVTWLRFSHWLYPSIQLTPDLLSRSSTSRRLRLSSAAGATYALFWHFDATFSISEIASSYNLARLALRGKAEVKSAQRSEIESSRLCSSHAASNHHDLVAASINFELLTNLRSPSSLATTNPARASESFIFQKFLIEIRLPC